MPHSAPSQRSNPLAAPGSKVMDTALAFGFGRLQVGLAAGAADMEAVLELRAARFRSCRGGSDLDRFDPACQHVLIRSRDDGSALAAARLRLLESPRDMAQSYTGQFYDLGQLAASGLRLLEIGRICIAEGRMQDPDILRALLAALTRRAVALDADMLVGCASFSGADVLRHAPALRHLAARHIGPAALRPRRRCAQAVDLPEGPSERTAGLRHIPPLLRMYLGMGGWVSDHAVCDPDLDTLHVFAAVETGRIPPARLRVLQALARS